MTEQFYYDMAAQILPLIGGTVIGYLWEKKKALTEQKKDAADQQEALANAVRVLCKIELRHIFYGGKANGNKLTSEDWQDADEIYGAYHSLGGNGRGTKLIEKIHEMGTA